MKNLRLLPAAFLLAACAAPALVQEDAAGMVVIENFRRGLICDAGGPLRRVCTDAEEIPISGEDRCIFDQREIACTWYGFSFDYILPREQVVLDCTWTTDRSATDGSPQEVRSRGASSGKYEIRLRNGRGHYLHPQYFGVSGSWAADHAGEVQRSTQSCAYGGKTLFEFRFVRRLVPGNFGAVQK